MIALSGGFEHFLKTLSGVAVSGGGSDAYSGVFFRFNNFIRWCKNRCFFFAQRVVMANFEYCIRCHKNRRSETFAKSGGFLTYL